MFCKHRVWMVKKVWQGITPDYFIVYSFTNSYGQNIIGMIDTTIKSYGEFIDYSILPEYKRAKLVSIKTEEEFKNILAKHDAKKWQ